ncbi:MAG TPA: dTDP-4-dehydrorhamnose 3,5-epimerase [Gemmata sp.]|nr:dTDP-4-dehydrorhamnose 3,5-epimerase [Gemmata sp.]
MRFVTTSITGVFVIEPELRADERGFFARTWCRDEFAGQGLATNWVQCNLSFNHRACTLRGMHWQAAPFEEIKLVRCTRGAAYDVVLDMRPESATFCKWVGVEITAENHKAVYIPAGCAHGFQTLTDATELFYNMSEFYHPETTRGVRWDDPAFGIVWPTCEARIIAARDVAFPDFSP